MHITVVTPDKSIFTGAITSLKVPGVGGEFEILKGHAPIVSALKNGKVRIIQADGERKIFEIHKGFVEVLKDDISLLVQGVVE